MKKVVEGAVSKWDGPFLSACEIAVAVAVGKLQFKMAMPEATEDYPLLYLFELGK